MIEIIVLIFLTREIGNLAVRKGLKSGIWKFYMVIGWILMEIVGAFVGVMIFGQGNLVSILLVAIAFAITSYFFLKANLNKRPDADLNDDIHRIGNRD